MINELKKEAKDKLGIEDGTAFFSPGRANLIGEHIDYNGGYVFPCALNIGTYGIAKKREDRKIRLYSKNFDNMGVIEASLDNLVYDKKYDWANYVLGVCKELNPKLGFDMYVFGNIPNGSGLSSSASLELLVAYVVNEFENLGYDRVSLVKFSQHAENEFIGVKCGIMDQFIIGVANLQSAILLNTNTLDYKQTKISFGDYELVILNTCKVRKLGESKYNERRAQCEDALAILKQTLNINYLCDMTPSMWEENKHLISDEILAKRVKHCVYENERTKLCFDAFLNNDLITVGKLLDQSHESLKNDYEVSGLHLDSIVEAIRCQKGCIGARMTGAGFGGCAIALVKKGFVDDAIKNAEKLYTEKTGLTPKFYRVALGGGVDYAQAE